MYAKLTGIESVGGEHSRRVEIHTASPVLSRTDPLTALTAKNYIFWEKNINGYKTKNYNRKNIGINNNNKNKVKTNSVGT